ncbi:MAG: 3-phosphoshikimate 1-carboxyvinyltransferase [Bacteroides sp.]
MQYKLTAPEHLATALRLPASKSISNRALILHALARGTHRPENLSDCDDTRVMIRALEGNAAEIDILAAGTAMRFLTAYLSVTPGTRLLTGTQRMQQRPIRILVDALRSLGADIAYAGNEGFPPLLITGSRLQGEGVTLAGNVSSQYISALLMVGAVLPQGLRLQLTGEIVSRPYIDLTLLLMRDFGAQAAWEGADRIVVKPGGYRDTPFTVESDWSAASYWYQMMALRPTCEENPAPSVELYGLFPRSYQGDSLGADLFARLGVRTAFTDRGVRLSKMGVPVARLVEDLVEIPDLAQTFVVTCCLMNIPFRFTGLQSLKIKETDRIQALINELHKLGYVIHSEQDSILSWNGERCPAEADPLIATYEDHRMAMAFAPACLCVPHLRIDHPEVVSKSYPAYWDDLRAAGFGVTSCE